jgi:HD-GYP domain-containing protein (c-di-GMP phosphodiesterase class II)
VSGDPVRFLTALSQALSTLGLYGERHPASARASEEAYTRLVELRRGAPRLDFTFFPDEVLFGRDLLPELGRWEWSARLARSGIERLEITADVSADHFERFLQHAAGLLGLSEAGAGLWQDGPEGIRIGRVRLERGEHEQWTVEPLPVATLVYSLREERDAVTWVHEEVGAGHAVPLLEAYGVVGARSLAKHPGQAMVLPLLQLKEFDQYTTTHSMNVSVLTMALGESLGLSPSAVRAFGLAGLLHDLGKVRIPPEILAKPGKLTPEERRVVEAHPADGARMLLDGSDPLDLAAVVAYEHHRCHDGRGYPRPHYARERHQASRLVHVCDVYDALRTRRPYRDAWSSGEALDYIHERAGGEFDPAMSAAFIELMRKWDDRTALRESA